MRSTTRRLLALPVAATLLFGAAACSSDDAPTGGSSAGATTGTTPEAEKPAEGGTFELTPANFADMVDKQIDAGTYHTTMTIGAEGQTINAEGDARLSDSGAEMTMTMSVPGMDGGMELRMVGGKLYMNMGELTGDKFYVIDPTDADDPIASSFGSSLDQMSAAESMESIKDAIVSVEKAGDPETIDGVDAQPYEVVVDTTKVTGAAGEQFQQAEEAGATLPDTISYVYFVGPDGLPRKMTMDLEGSTTEMTFSDWGEDVTIEAPAKDQITDSLGGL
ncbi:hypothetical protein [Cellulomonas massiliensis]|uniref:hypothetical protein n=1 Tax=Cellulomonas massiliensis TaxID=1465811 RepID=UPI0002E2D019|nr:hypothetical protein [Cellulomonas massiliensis]